MLQESLAYHESRPVFTHAGCARLPHDVGFDGHISCQHVACALQPFPVAIALTCSRAWMFNLSSCIRPIIWWRSAGARAKLGLLTN